MIDKKKAVASLVAGTLGGLAATAVVLMIFAFITVKMQNVNYDVFLPVVIAAACIGAFCGGYLSARINRSAGLAIGAVSAVLIFAVLLCVSAALGAVPQAAAALRLAAMVISGAIGGVLGVNKRRKKRKFNLS